MAFTFSDKLVTDLLNGVGIATQFPQGAKLQIFTGAAAAITAAPTGTKLWELVLPASPWAAPAARAIAKNGTWSAAGIAAGNAGYFRLVDATDTGTADNTHRRIQGSCGATGSGADMELDNVSIAVGQTATVTGFQVNG